MSKEYDICCTGLENFLDNVDAGLTGIQEELLGTVEGEFKRFKYCPYCGIERKQELPEQSIIFDAHKEYALKWEKEFEIGIPWIDSQHKKLLDHLNTLINAVIRENNVVKAEDTIKFLQQYVKAHFGTEESIMRKHNFPGHNQHKHHHEEFVQNVNLIASEFEKQGATDKLLIRITKDLWRWYKNHILKTDMEFGDFLKNKYTVADKESAEEVFESLMQGKNK